MLTFEVMCYCQIWANIWHSIFWEYLQTSLYILGICWQCQLWWVLVAVVRHLKRFIPDLNTAPQAMNRRIKQLAIQAWKRLCLKWFCWSDLVGGIALVDSMLWPGSCHRCYSAPCDFWAHDSPLSTNQPSLPMACMTRCCLSKRDVLLL